MPSEDSTDNHPNASDSEVGSGFRRAAAKVKEFPQKPGVYLMKDAAGRVIYVGNGARPLHACFESHRSLRLLEFDNDDSLVCREDRR